MQVEHKFFVGVQDAGLNNEIGNKAILEALSNIASVHGNLVNQGINDLDKTSVTWVISNWKLEVLKRVKACETILVRTWAQENSKIQADRDFQVLNEQGELIAKATSRWTAVNLKTGRIERITDEIINPYQPEKDHNNFEGFEFEKINESELEIIDKIKFKICKFMIDCNRHVHNTAYLDIAMEVLPEEIDRINFNNVEVNYKKEIKPDGIVTVEYAKKDNKNYVIIKDDEEKQIHAVIILY